MISFLLYFFAAAFFMAAFFSPEPVLSFALATVVHELGHMFSAKLLGVNVKKVSFTPFCAVIETEMPRSIILSVIILLSGPIANILVSSATLLFFEERFFLFSSLNFAMAILNLLPVSKLDGGRLLSIICEAVSISSYLPKAVKMISDIILFGMGMICAYRMLRFGDSFLAFFFVFFCSERFDFTLIGRRKSVLFTRISENKREFGRNSLYNRK